MKLIYICSPLKGDIQGNIEKARGYCREALLNGYLPIAPHIYFTQFLDDTNETERLLGMKCGIELLPMCDELWVYGEPSEGMQKEIAYWEENVKRPIRATIFVKEKDSNKIILCENCGKILYKYNGNRKYCDDIDCIRERNRQRKNKSNRLKKDQL